VVVASICGPPVRLGTAGVGVVVGGGRAAAPADPVDEVLREVRRRHGGELVDDTAVVVVGWGGATA
jgi:hypothetical protein